MSEVNLFIQKQNKRLSLCRLQQGSVFYAYFCSLVFYREGFSAWAEPFSIIAHYGGLSAPALSVYLNSTPLESPYIGLTTLWDIYSKLRVLGLSLPQI